MADLNDFNQKLNETVTDLTDTRNTTGEYDPRDIENNKVMAILAYVGILILIPLFTARDSKFARFHLNQGLILVVIEVILSIVFAVVGWIPLVGWLVKMVRWLVSAICFIFAIIGIINAANGQAKELPFIGGIRLLN